MKLPARRASRENIASRTITITGMGDHHRPEWPITITGIRTPEEDRAEPGHNREAEDLHGRYEATAPKHHWADWYAAYLVARERGRASREAEMDAARYMQSDG